MQLLQVNASDLRERLIDNQRDFNSLLKDCVPNVYHRFSGRHALGGERHDREALGRWLARLERPGPDMKLLVNHVIMASTDAVWL
jgi:hypothetical protein